MDRLADRIIERVNPSFYNDIYITRLTTKGGRGRLLGAINFAFSIVQLLFLIALRRVDVLHLNLAAYGSFYRKRIMAVIASQFAIPYVVHIHSGRFIEFWDEANKSRKHGINKFMRNSKQIVVLGSVYRDLVARHAPDCVHKVSVMPNSSPTRPTRSRQLEDLKKPLRIVFLGTLLPLKGIPQLLDAFANLKHRSDWVATLAGSAGLAEARARVKELGLDRHVSLPGWLVADQVDELLAESDMLVLPSFTEGQPMAIIEAFSWGLPVIATPINAIVDVVQHERNGLLVEPGDVDGLTEALSRLLDDDSLRLRLGAAALEDHVRYYSTESYVRRMTTLWHAAAATDSQRVRVVH